MMHERYFFISYPLVGLFTMALGFAVYRRLRTSFESMTARLSPPSLRDFLRYCFRIGFMLPFAAFLSVSYRGCGNASYTEVMTDLPHLIHKNQEQVGDALSSLSLVLLFWLLASVVILRIARKNE